MNKKDLSERDICTKFITPAIIKSGWDKDSQIREEACRLGETQQYKPQRNTRPDYFGKDRLFLL